MRLAVVVGVSGALLMFIGARQPWATLATGSSVSGVDSGDGVITIAIAFVVGSALVAALLGMDYRVFCAMAFTGALIAVFVGIYNMTEVAGAADTLSRAGFPQARIDGGLWLTVLGGLVAAGASGVALLGNLGEKNSAVATPSRPPTSTYRPPQTTRREPPPPPDARYRPPARREVVLNPEEFKRVREARSEVERRAVRQEAVARHNAERHVARQEAEAERRARRQEAKRLEQESRTDEERRAEQEVARRNSQRSKEISRMMLEAQRERERRDQA